MKDLACKMCVLGHEAGSAPAHQQVQLLLKYEALPANR
jgi:hypothetical protein